jgi:uncharacterized surface protein with fasciclin (FAS1) repeats
MIRTSVRAAVAALALAAAAPAVAFAADSTIVETAVATPDLSTLTAAVKAAGLVETLSGPGPFTVFAPTNAAFAALPAGAVDTLLQPANKQQLQGVLTYHVVAGKVSAADLAKKIAAGGGKATLKTVAGGELTAKQDGAAIVLTDAKGRSAKVAAADLEQKNGVVHVIDAVLLP